MKRFKWINIKRFARNETGASYALPYVLTFPIFLWLMALLLQASLILMCKIGTVYAAHSTARTVTVWQGNQPEDSGNLKYGKAYMSYKAKRAATTAMVPFANSYVNARKKLFPLYPSTLDTATDEQIEQGGFAEFDFGKMKSKLEEINNADLPLVIAQLLGELVANVLADWVDEEAYVRVYLRLNEDAVDKENSSGILISPIIKNRRSRVNTNYIRNKYKYAAAATRVTIPDDDVGWNEDLTVTVKYRMAFHIPGTSRLLGGKRPFWMKMTGGNTFCRDIESSVTIPSEAAKAEGVGIPHKIIYLKIL
jgi:hypothetical protein